MEVIDNRSKINRCLRQCLNARIQSTAASMTKQAMIMIDNDPILNDLGFHLLITVHDEVFGECPRCNAELASKRLSEVMVKSAKTKCCCKFKCDGYEVVDGWYEDECGSQLKKEFENSIKKDNLSEEAALNKVYKKYSMFDYDAVKAACLDTYEIGRDSLKHGLNYYKVEER